MKSIYANQHSHTASFSGNIMITFLFYWHCNQKYLYTSWYLDMELLAKHFYITKMHNTLRFVSYNRYTNRTVQPNRKNFLNTPTAVMCDDQLLSFTYRETGFLWALRWSLSLLLLSVLIIKLHLLGIQYILHIQTMYECATKFLLRILRLLFKYKILLNILTIIFGVGLLLCLNNG